MLTDHASGPRPEVAAALRAHPTVKFRYSSLNFQHPATIRATAIFMLVTPGCLEGLCHISGFLLVSTVFLDLGTKGKATVAAIFVDAQTRLRKPTNLKALTDAIEKLDWFSAREEGLGNLYEGLLEKNAAEKKSGAGQYFTPRPLIDCIVRLMKPQSGEIIQDPAAGTGGFLVAADHYIKERTDDLFKLPKEQIHFQKHNAFVGLELVPDAHRLCLMNLMLQRRRRFVGRTRDHGLL